MTMPLETNHLAFLGLNFNISGVETIKTFVLKLGQQSLAGTVPEKLGNSLVELGEEMGSDWL